MINSRAMGWKLPALAVVVVGLAGCGGGTPKPAGASAALPSTSATTTVPSPEVPATNGNPLGTPVQVTDPVTGKHVGTVTAYQLLVHATEGPLRGLGGPRINSGPLAVIVSPPAQGEYLQVVVAAVGLSIGLEFASTNFSFTPNGSQTQVHPVAEGTTGWDDPVLGVGTVSGDLRPLWSLESFDVPAGTSGTLNYSSGGGSASGAGEWAIPASPNSLEAGACAAHLSSALGQLRVGQSGFPASIPTATPLEAGILFPPILVSIMRAAANTVATGGGPGGFDVTDADLVSAAQAAPVRSSVTAACLREQQGTQPVIAAPAAVASSGLATATGATIATVDHLVSSRGTVTAMGQGQVVAVITLAPVTQLTGSDVVTLTISNRSDGPYTFNPALTYIGGANGGNYTATPASPIVIPIGQSSQLSLKYSGEPAQGAWNLGLTGDYNVAAAVCFTIGQPFPATNHC